MERAYRFACCCALDVARSHSTLPHVYARTNVKEDEKTVQRCKGANVGGGWRGREGGKEKAEPGGKETLLSPIQPSSGACVKVIAPFHHCALPSSTTGFDLLLSMTCLSEGPSPSS